MAESDYKQFCPIAMAAEILCSRWTILLLRELLSGSTRFNDLKRGLPRMSTALLSLRLKELEQAGILQRRPVPGEPGIAEYQLTRAGKELEPLVMAFGVWGQRWVDKKLSLERLDVGLLMWDMRRNINPEPMPDRRCTIEFIYPGAPPDQRAWWLVIAPGKGVDLCHVDPGYDVDLYISADLKAMTAIWMGHDTVRKAVEGGQVKLTGDKALARDMQKWLGLSPFAKEKAQIR